MRFNDREVHSYLSFENVKSRLITDSADQLHHK